MKTKDIFIGSESIADNFVKSFEFPYEVLPNIKEYIIKLSSDLNEDYKKIKESIWVHKSAKISDSACINGPCIIDEGAELRHNAFIRGNVIIGKNSVVGNSCELKNTILYDYVQVPHFNYVGDSILGNYAHLGAGTIISNLKSDKSNIKIKNNDEIIDTLMRKVGAFIGDNVEVGCNCVINPGTIIMPNSNIYPLTNIRGIVKSNVIVKSMNNIINKKNLNNPDTMM